MYASVSHCFEAKALIGKNITIVLSEVVCCGKKTIHLLSADPGMDGKKTMYFSTISITRWIGDTSVLLFLVMLVHYLTIYDYYYM